MNENRFIEDGNGMKVTDAKTGLTHSLDDGREQDLSEYGQGKWRMIDGKWQRVLTHRDVKV